MKTKYKILMFISFLTFLTLYQIYTYSEFIEESGYVALQRLYIPSVIAIIVVIIFSILLNFNIIKPIERITGYIVDISHGELDIEIDPRLKESRDEIGELARAFDRTIVSLKLAMKMTAPELKKESDILKKALEEKEKAREELRVSRDYVNNILKSISDTLLVVNPDGTIKTANQAALDLLGYERDELIGKQIDDIIAPVRGKGRIIFKEIFKLGGLLERDFIRDQEIIYRSKEGGRIQASLSGSVMRDKNGDITGIVVIARDITKRKSAEEEIRKTRDVLENLVRTSPDAIVTTDMKGIVTSFNEAAEEMFGYSREEAVGKPASIFIADREKLHEVVKLSVRDGVVRNFEMPYKTKGGGEVLTSLSYTVLKDKEGNPIGTVGISRDITDRKRVGEALHEMEDK